MLRSARSARSAVRPLRPLMLALAPAALLPVLLLAAVALPTARGQEKFPEPSLYPTDWELKFQHKTPRRIVVNDSTTGKSEAFWYMPYTVTNPGDKPIEFVPTFGLLSRDAADGKIHPGNMAISQRVFDAVFQREGNKFLEPQRKIQGTLNPGEEQARDGVAIWREPTMRMGTFDVFVGGLSGEYVIMKKKDGQWVVVDRRKAAEELKGVPESDRLTLRKTLQLTFHVPGDNIRPGEDPVNKKGEKWVMR
jgi:hypothetical protein